MEVNPTHHEDGQTEEDHPQGNPQRIPAAERVAPGRRGAGAGASGRAT